MITTKDEKLSVGQFIHREFEAESRKVAASHNSAGYSGIYAAVARKLVVEYPALSTDEKRTVLGTLQGAAESIRSRTGIDSTSGLRSAAMILGL